MLSALGCALVFVLIAVVYKCRWKAVNADGTERSVKYTRRRQEADGGNAANGIDNPAAHIEDDD